MLHSLSLSFSSKNSSSLFIGSKVPVSPHRIVFFFFVSRHQSLRQSTGRIVSFSLSCLLYWSCLFKKKESKKSPKIRSQFISLSIHVFDVNDLMRRKTPVEQSTSSSMSTRSIALMRSLEEKKRRTHFEMHDGFSI